MQHKIEIRCYGELNDFLPVHMRHRSFTITVRSHQTIKDILEALGIPHTEIELILANGEIADFGHRPENGMRTAVYPKFESFDISEISHLQPQPLREVRFILDVHLGKLGRYLRMMGFDVLYQPDFEDKEIIRISGSEKRIILTRDTGILKNGRVTHGLFVRQVKPWLQLQEVMGRLDLHKLANPFTRCMDCNGMLEKVDKSEVEAGLMPDTRKNYHEFFRCRGCGNILWRGTHYQRMRSRINGIMPDNARPADDQ